MSDNDNIKRIIISTSLTNPIKPLTKEELVKEFKKCNC